MFFKDKKLQYDPKVFEKIQIKNWYSIEIYKKRANIGIIFIILCEITRYIIFEWTYALWKEYRITTVILLIIAYMLVNIIIERWKNN